MKHIQEMIEARGGVAAVRADYLPIENPPYMRLVIEVVSPSFPDGSCEISVAHYGEMNGDAMRDPEITFLVKPDAGGRWEWTPLTFTNDYMGVYQVAAEYDHAGRVTVLSEDLRRDLLEFATMWDRNVKEQGFMDALRTKTSTR